MNQNSYYSNISLIRLINKKTSSLNSFTNYLANRNIYKTNLIGVARFILATGTLLTLMLSPYNAIFVEGSKNSTLSFFNNLNLFIIIKSHVVAKLLSCTILLAVISGYLPQITGILHWWVSFSLFNKGYLVDGGDQITSILTLFLIPITVCEPRLNNWYKGNKNCNPYFSILVNVALFFISLQMSILYFHSSQAKLNVAEWTNGTAVYYYLNNNLYGPVPIVKNIVLNLLSIKIFAVLSTWSILIFEILLFAAIFMTKNTKKKLLYYALVFHFIIIILHGLVSFFFAMTGGLLLYLYPIEENVPFFSIEYWSFLSYNKVKLAKKINKY